MARPGGHAWCGRAIGRTSEVVRTAIRRNHCGHAAFQCLQYTPLDPPSTEGGSSSVRAGRILVARRCLQPGPPAVPPMWGRANATHTTPLPSPPYTPQGDARVASPSYVGLRIRRPLVLRWQIRLSYLTEADCHIWRCVAIISMRQVGRTKP